MIKKIVGLVIILVILIGFSLPVNAAGITIKNTSVTPSFPGSIKFDISAQSSTTITDVRLHYSVEASSFIDVTAEGVAQFTPGTSVTTSWTWDMVRSGGLPTGTVVNYWWTVKDASGGSASTTLTQLKFDDTRYSWQEITSGYINLFWYQGNRSFADTLMTTAQNAVVNLETQTGATLQKSVNLYIYGSSSDLQGSMIYPQDWTGGVTFSQFNTIAIGISTSQLDWGKGAIAHELTHLVIHQITDNPYNGIPPWLDEGLAMYNQGPLDTSFSNALNIAISSGALLSLQTLSSPFSAYSQISYLSYAESYSAVDYLIKTYGKDKMFQLLDAYRQGTTNNDALMKVYGFDTQTLTTKWKTSIGAK
ncbi:MAG TPA: peptidase MA family metallohydrolase [Dehalococcoidales bacterium]|nr:peptidase MA family metallohydrolase [Dehalococcoidales bacterium]